MSVLLSGIPLFGLPHTVAIYRFSGDQDDGMGGIVPAGEVVVYASRMCRITKNTGAAEQHEEGVGREDMWQVLMEYSPNIRDNDICRISTMSGVDTVASPGDYTITKPKAQIDQAGGAHHTQFLMESV
jgi:hypothetical protein